VSRRSVPVWLLVLALADVRILAGGQGMGRTVRTPRAVPAIETTLPPIEVRFTDIAEEAGLTARNVSGRDDIKRYILEATGNGVAIFDADGDGLQDVFIANATTLDDAPDSPPPTSHLYRNLGGLRFEDITARAGLQRVGWGQGVCVGDYDNDGHRDLFVTHYGQSLLYRNLGDATFQDVSEAAGIRVPGRRWDTGCTFVDYDRDGRLDLAVTSYLEFDQSKVPTPGSSGYCQWKGMPVMCGPRGFPFARNRLYRNAGDGRFIDVSEASGVGSVSSCYGFTVTAADVNGDGYADLYVACDSTPSLLYVNLKNGRFEESGLLSGVALNDDGQEQGGMGVATGDYDEDGDIDIVKTNFADDVPNLYRNHGDGTFEDRVFEAGLGAYMQYVGWGVHFLDVDHDGRKEVLMVNGHVYPEAGKLQGLQYRQPRLLYWNVGGRFKDISAGAGPGISELQSSRGSAVGDFDNDGSLEVLIVNMGARPSLLRNSGPKKHWLVVAGIGSQSNRDAIGARIQVIVGDRRLSGEIQGASGYLSQNDPRVHVGLGDAVRYDRIDVQWPSGMSERFPGGAADRIVTLVEGTGTAIREGTAPGPTGPANR
jgi:enediyne biosynthesis protein E4